MKSHFLPASALVWATFVLLWAIAPVLLAAADNSTSKPRDVIRLSCGTSVPSIDSDGQTWTGDVGSIYAPSLNVDGIEASQQASSVPTVPFMTARVFTSPYTYSFPLAAGRKFIRLYFYPTNYSNHAASDAFFSVTSGNYTLLQNFSASLTAYSLNCDYLTREYSFVSTDGLNLTFTPSTTHNNKSYAFINGIEIVSIPDIFSTSNPMLIYGDRPVSFPIDQNQALETVYRLNVGGQAISPSTDSGLYRSWADDSPYIYGAGSGVTYSTDPNVTINYKSDVPDFIAPPHVYSTARSMGSNAQINLKYNLTWILQVDAGFYYLVRLHFCEIQYPVIKPNQRVFDIYLNNQTAELEADVIAWSGGIGIPVYKDYAVLTIGTGQTDLWVALHPDTPTKPEFYDAILNGLEVFKLQNSDNSLAGLNPEPLPQPNVDTSRILPRNEKHKINIAAIVGGVIGGFVVLLVGFCLIVICKCQKKTKKGKDAVPSDGPSGWLRLSLYGNSHSAASAKTTTGSYASPLPFCRYFSIAEIKAATNDFDESPILGVGFGEAYRGEKDGGATKVAITYGNPVLI